MLYLGTILELMLQKGSFKKIELVALLILGTYHKSSWKIIAQVSVVLNRTVVLRLASRNCAEVIHHVN